MIDHTAFNESDLIDPKFIDDLEEDSLLFLDDDDRVFEGMEVIFNESEIA